MTAKIYLFENLRLVVDGQPLPIRSEKIKSLLAYLTLHAGQPIDRSTIGEAIWPEVSESTARRNLREYLYRLRSFLSEEWPVEMPLATEGDTIYFDPTDSVWIDVEAFRQHLTTADRQHLQQAVDLYRGDLLASFWDDWVDEHRQHFRTRYLQALTDLCHAHHRAGDLPAAIDVAQRALTYDPLNEGMHRQLMRLYYESGDRARALEQYRQCRQTLSDELAARPMPETRQLYQHMLDGTYAQPSTQAPPTVTPPTDTPTTPFVGRSADLDRLSHMAPFVIVTGASGIGKTRLVNEWLPADALVLRGRSHEFEQRIAYQPLLDALQQSLHLIPWESVPTASWLAPLAHLLPDLYYYIPDLTAADSNLEVGHYIQESFAQLLLSFTRQLDVILFLDDLHWADSATWDFLRFLPRRAPQIEIVATFTPDEAPPAARRRLRTSAAQRLPLEHLSPAALSELANRTLPTTDAFAHRLHDITGGNPFFAIEIMQALEESAARPPYTPAHLADLATPHAVKVLIESRLDRLDPPSQRALSIAAAFRREFTVEMLAHAAEIEIDSLLDMVDVWLQRGLVIEAPTHLDFSHQQVREVAFDRLSGPRRRRVHSRIAEAIATHAPDAYDRIISHYAASHHPARAIPALVKAGRRALHARAYDQSHQLGHQLLDIIPADDDLNKALAYMFMHRTDDALAVLNHIDPARRTEVALHLARVYWVRGEALPARRYAEQAHDLLTAESPYRLAVLRLLGRIAVAQGRFEAAVGYLEDSLDGNRLNQANTYGYLATAYGHLQQREPALHALNRALDLALEIDSAPLVAVAHVKAGVTTCALQMWSEARRHTETGLAASQDLGLDVYVFVARAILGRITYYEGHPARALTILHEAAQWATSNDYLLFRHLPHLFLAEVALAQNDAETVRQQAEIVLSLAQRTGNQWSRARITDYLAQLE